MAIERSERYPHVAKLVTAYACELYGQLSSSMPAEIEPAIGEALIDPVPVARMFLGYLAVVRRMASLTDEELDIIEAVNQRINTNRLDPRQGADHFVREVSQFIPRERFVGLVAEAARPRKALYQAAIGQLADWLKTAHEYYEELRPIGGTPSDSDQRTHTMIWSPSQVPNPEANYQTIQHMLACHGVERYVYHTLLVGQMEMAQTKDFLVSALADTIAYDVAQNGDQSPFAELAALWQKPKSEGGLGWLRAERIAAYKEKIQRKANP